MQVLQLFRTHLTGAANEVFESRQLLYADGSACVQLARRNADLGAETELASVSELCRRIVQYDCRVDRS